MRRLGNAELDRLLDATGAKARGRGRRHGATVRTKPCRASPPVTLGQEELILAALETGLGPAAIAREFRLSRAQVDVLLAAPKPRGGSCIEMAIPRRFGGVRRRIPKPTRPGRLISSARFESVDFVDNRPQGVVQLRRVPAACRGHPDSDPTQKPKLVEHRMEGVEPVDNPASLASSLRAFRLPHARWREPPKSEETPGRASVQGNLPLAGPTLQDRGELASDQDPTGNPDHAPARATYGPSEDSQSSQRPTHFACPTIRASAGQGSSGQSG